tara:strand:- start:746 stop:1465 length:720 start_codon:yes stop_codon:yes gene_type:complete
MDKIFIKEFLEDQVGVKIEDIKLGDFDIIGEYTAKKNRGQNSDLYREVGCFFRPNYERGILMYHLIKKHRIESVLEIGFGRGYSAFCMAKAMCDFGIDGKITTVDPNFNKDLLNQLTNIFPKVWFEKIEFVSGTSDQFFNTRNADKYDFIYIDGDHRYEYVKNDWENCKDKFNKFLLFDDYIDKKRAVKDIECSQLIDKISEEEFDKNLIIMDRRIFFDDRRISDDEIDYGQVLIARKE